MTPGSQGRGRAAVRGPAVFRDAGQDRELPGAPSVYMVNERASCAADWWMFCPASWNDQALAEPVAAAGVRRRREQAGIPGEVRHKEKWRLALDMIDEMTGPGGWGVLEAITAADGARPAVDADIAMAITPCSVRR